MSRASPAEFTVTLGSGTTGRGACAPSTSWSLSRRSAPRVRQLCTCVDFASRLAGRKRARAGPGMLTQPGRSHTSLSRNAMLLLLQQRGEGKAPVVAGRLTRWGPLRHSLTPPHPAKGNSRGARVDEIGGSGRWRRNSGSAALRARSSHPNWKEPVPPGAGAERPQRRAQTLRARARSGLSLGCARACGKGGGSGGPRAPGQKCPQSGRQHSRLTVQPSARLTVQPGAQRCAELERAGGGVRGLPAARAGAVPGDPVAGLGQRRSYLP